MPKHAPKHARKRPVRAPRLRAFLHRWQVGVLALLILFGAVFGVGLQLHRSPPVQRKSNRPVPTVPTGGSAKLGALGVYAGNNNQAAVNSFAATTGAHVTMAETYLPWAASTGSSVGWSYLTTRSDLASWLSSYAGTNDRMVMGLPMVALDGSGKPENTLAQGAAGDEDANS